MDHRKCSKKGSGPPPLAGASAPQDRPVQKKCWECSMKVVTKYEKHDAVQCCDSESKAKNKGVCGKTHETPLKTNKATQHESQLEPKWYIITR